MPSTRRVTRDSGTYTRSTAGPRALTRGLELLRAFLPSASSLTNAQLAERTGLPRPTVSRLLRVLVDDGFLAHDPRSGSYKLAPVHLSLALAFRFGTSELNATLPLMRRIARGERVNVGLATGDGLKMVYLETYREARGPITRTVVAGSRVRMESSALGHAYLAGLEDASRSTLLAALAQEHGATWPALERAISRSLRAVRRQGYCRSDLILGLVGLAAPVIGPDGTLYAVNLTFSPEEADDATVARNVRLLQELVSEITREWQELAALERADPLV